MEGEICKTIKIMFTPDEVRLLLEIVTEENVKAVAVSHGQHCERVWQSLINILVNA